MTNAHVDDLVEEYALGLLDAEQSTRVEEHLAACPFCCRKADIAARTAAWLGHSVEAVVPPPEVAQRIAQRVRASRRRRSSLTRHPSPAARLSFNPWPLITIANLALTVVVAVWALSLQAQVRRLSDENLKVVERLARAEKRVVLVSSPSASVIALAGTENAPGAGGRAYLDPDSSLAWITVHNLPKLGEGQTYQAWLIGPEGPVSAGTFNTAADGRGEIWMTEAEDLAMYYAVGVSLEPAGGSPQPTNVVVVGGV